MITREEYESALKIVKDYQEQVTNEYNRLKAEVSIIETKFVTSDSKICESVSARLCSSLMRIDIDVHGKLSDLKGISVNNLYKIRNTGKKTIQELIEICAIAGVELSR